MRTKAVETRAELLKMLDEGLGKSRKALEGTTEENLRKSWRLRMNEQVASEDPRYVMISDGALSHMAHHRGQLTVYLGLKEAKVPAIYGPSADERATQGNLKPGRRSAFWSNVNVQEQPALVPSAAMTASANEPCPSLRATMALKTSCSFSTASTSV